MFTGFFFKGYDFFKKLKNYSYFTYTGGRKQIFTLYKLSPLFTF